MNANPQADYMARRRQAAQEIADKLGCSIERVFCEWRRSEEEQRKWLATLQSTGFNTHEDLTDYLRRVNNQPAPAKV